MTSSEGGATSWLEEQDSEVRLSAVTCVFYFGGGSAERKGTSCLCYTYSSQNITTRRQTASAPFPWEQRQVIDKVYSNDSVLVEGVYKFIFLKFLYKFYMEDGL